MIKFFRQHPAWVLLILASIYLLLVTLQGSRAAENSYAPEPSSVIRKEFSGLEFRTLYQSGVKIKTPIIVEMDQETRRLNVVLKDPDSARVKFLAKITPLDFVKMAEALKSGEDTYLLHSRVNRLNSEEYNIAIDTVIVVIDRGKNKWLTEYEDAIKQNHQTCKPTKISDGLPDVLCNPLLIEARVTKITRDYRTPDLPPTHEFPHLDYLDVYLEILKVTLTK